MNRTTNIALVALAAVVLLTVGTSIALHFAQKSHNHMHYSAAEVFPEGKGAAPGEIIAQTLFKNSYVIPCRKKSSVKALKNPLSFFFCNVVLIEFYFHSIPLFRHLLTGAYRIFLAFNNFRKTLKLKR